jgi:hypothetical protein
MHVTEGRGRCGRHAGPRQSDDGLGGGRPAPAPARLEHCLLGAEERERCQALLRRLGYELMEEHFDTRCLDTTIDDPVSRAWRRLRPRMPAFYLRDPR